ncbi:hypothetical protein [Pseudomonas sp. 1152_12]|uniref:hypothetical protein n=1 Tax=Pseudomonas sp. 1152_12 TaxID=2604455 RepID=UPI0040639330
MGIENFSKYLEVFIEGDIQAKPVELNELLGELKRHHFIPFVSNTVIVDVDGQARIKFTVTVYNEQGGA